MNAQITAIINQKGGVGKTTSTVNLGVGLAREGKKVLLVDADPQGSLSISMGLQNPDELSDTLSTLMLAEMEYRPIYPDHGIIHHKEGVDLLPGNIELSGVELSLFNTMSRELVLRNVLDRLRCNYDYILIDCMPSLGLMNINALAAADSVIIPLQPHFLSTKGLNLLLRSVARVRRQINPKLRIDGILFTMVDSRTNNSQSIMSSLRSTVGDSIRVFNTEIPRSVRAVEAAEQGKSIYLLDKNGKVAEAYANRIEEQVERTAESMKFPHLEGVSRDIIDPKEYEPLYYEDDLNDKVVVIKSDALRREYQQGPYQLRLCTGGFGASPKSRGSACFCRDLLTGKSSRFERLDIAGIYPMEKLPEWAKKGLEICRQKQAAEREER